MRKCSRYYSSSNCDLALCLSRTSFHDRLDADKKNYQYLLSSVKRYLERKRLGKNKQALAKGLGGHLDSVAAPATDKGKGKSNSKHKGKGKKDKQDSICFQFRDTGTCNRDKCPFAHAHATPSVSINTSRKFF